MKITEAGRSTPDVRILGAVCAASGVMPRRASRAAPNKGRRPEKNMVCVLIGSTGFVAGTGYRDVTTLLF